MRIAGVHQSVIADVRERACANKNTHFVNVRFFMLPVYLIALSPVCLEFLWFAAIAIVQLHVEDFTVVVIFRNS